MPFILYGPAVHGLFHSRPCIFSTLCNVTEIMFLSSPFPLSLWIHLYLSRSLLGITSQKRLTAPFCVLGPAWCPSPPLTPSYPSNSLRIVFLKFLPKISIGRKFQKLSFHKCVWGCIIFCNTQRANLSSLLQHLLLSARICCCQLL